ncbi:RHS repeat-associated core domain-containing protein [Ferribacterium limneticum]|uniref:RHS repeat-associated core domain-containing protein n=1 Tax=Ferribacterium limneticum TaxID=76259 RepID=UPI00384BDC1F|nr:hypothetical protein KI617_03100 [Ferribacterium limneticum]UCV33021.1 hypothetical protein KI608_03100 [Ferribacterium limneticum]
MSETDYVGSGLFPLKISRVYNGRADFLSRIGYNWRTGIQNSVTPVTYYETQVNGIENRALKFSWNGNQWIADGDVPERLVRLTNTSDTTLGWILRAADDKLESYNAKGRLLSITDRQKQIQTLTYSDGSVGTNGGYVLDVDGNATTVVLPSGLVIRLTDANGRSLHFGYDTSLQIVMITNPAGGIFRYTYDANRNLKSVTFPDNKVRTYHYNEQANTSNTNLPHILTGITDENGIRYITYTYDSTGRAIGEILAGNVESYGLNFGANNTVVSDPLGTQRTYNFQTILGVVKNTGVSQPGGSGCGPASSAITYDTNGNVATRTDFNGNTTTYTYDLTRNLETQRVEAAGKPEQRTITTQWHPYWRLPVKIAEPKKLTTWIYNGDNGGYCAPQTAIVPSLSGGTQPIGVVCSQSEQATTDLTGGAGLSTMVTGSPRSWSYTYDTYGQVLTANGPRTDVADVTTTTYYAADDPDLGKRGNIATVTNALGHLTRYTAYDLNGRPLSITDPNGTVTTLSYTPRGWLKTRSVAGQTTTYDYTPWGGLAQVSYPDGSGVSYTHDAAHRLTAIVDSAGRGVHYTLDPVGHRLQEDYRNADGSPARQVSRVFDALGRLKDEIEGNSPPHTLGYTANGEPRYRITAKGDTTTDDIDPLGRPVKRTDPENGSAQPTLMAYDRLDQLTRLTAPNGAVTAFDIDGLGNVWKESSADRGSVDSTFDAAGNALTRKDARGLTVTQTYDALNRLTQVSTSNGQIIRYTWDAGCPNGIGRLCQKTDGAGTTTYAYDARGNLLSETRSEGGRSFTTTTAHNAADRPTDVLAPTGETLVPTLDPGGKTQTLSATGGGTTTAIASAIAYSATGQITAQQLGLTWLTVNYDSAGRADTVSATPSNAANDSNGDVPLPGWALAVLGATLFGLTRRRQAGATLSLFVACILTLFLAVPPAQAADLDLDYDANGNVISKTTAGGTTAYTYDKLDRLDTEAGPPGNRDHAYDPNGNRTSDGAGTTATFTPNTDRVATINGVSVTLDAAGNLTADGTYKYVWDDFGDLTELRKADNTLIATYYYDDRHRRTRKVTTAAAPQGATTTFYIYLPDGRLLAEMGGSGEALMTYVWNGDILTGIIVHQPQRTVYTIQVDHLGTPYQVRTLDGKIVWRWEPDGYGRTQPNEDVDGDGKKLTLNIRFPGQYFDRESGLHYNWHRYYSPRIGYISPDPLGLEAGPNPYAYANQNPLRFSDPDGRNPIAIGAAIVAVGGAVIAASSQGGKIVYPPGHGPIGSFDPFKDTQAEVRQPSWPAPKNPLDCEARFSEDKERCRSSCGDGSLGAQALCLAKAWLKYQACRRISNPTGSNWTDWGDG